MKYSATHYPNSGIQHTRAVFALAMVTMFLGMYLPKPGTEIEAHMKKIETAAASCAELTKKKKLSQGAIRALEAATNSLEPYLAISKLGSDKSFARWAAFVWCALTFIEDAINTCPQYTNGSYKKRWGKLHALVNELAESINDQFPKFDEEGTMFYEMTAWALEGVEFFADDRLVA